MSALNPALLRAGHALVANDLPAAEAVLRPYLKQRPTDVMAIRMMAELAARVGRLAASENLLRRAAVGAGFHRRARQPCDRTLQAEPPRRGDRRMEQIEQQGSANLGHSSLKAAALSRIGGHDEALSLYRKLLEERPGEAKLWMSYGHNLKTVGEQTKSIAAYRRAIGIEPAMGEAWWSLANLKTIRFQDSDIARWKPRLKSADLSHENQFHLHFALGKSLEDRVGPKRRFAIIPRATGYAAGRSTMIGRTSMITSSARSLCSRLSCSRPDTARDAPHRIPSSSSDCHAGSTLVEQILSSHPDIEGTAELPDIPSIAAASTSAGPGAT